VEIDKVRLEQRARNLLSEMFGIAEERLQPEASISDDLNLDSIDIVDLLSSLNAEFNLDLSPMDFEGCVKLEEFLTRLFEQAVVRRAAVEKAALEKKR
jgi:acyl carrier protein